MFDVIKVDENRIDIHLSGKIDRDDMIAALDGLVEQAHGISNGTMLYTITDFQMPSMSAIGVEFARLPKLFSLIGKFDKAAVIADENWLRKAAEIEGALFPGLEIKAFNPGEETEAEAWLAA